MECENYPCSYEESGHCQVYQHNTNGFCSQCETGFWKKDINYPCVNCTQVFGTNCKFCQDYNGCGQCVDNQQTYYDSECGLYVCPHASTGNSTTGTYSIHININTLRDYI